MSAENKIVSVEFDVNKRIDARVEEILEGESITLPGGDHPLVEGDGDSKKKRPNCS